MKNFNYFFIDKICKSLILLLGNEDEMEVSECLPLASWTCPTPCKCSDGIADCRNKKLTHIPSHFPADTTEM